MVSLIKWKNKLSRLQVFRMFTWKYTILFLYRCMFLKYDTSSFCVLVVLLQGLGSDFSDAIFLSYGLIWRGHGLLAPVLVCSYFRQLSTHGYVMFMEVGKCI